MANLVLGAAGAAIGGPLGGAVGLFLGRQIDRSFGQGSRARLSDLRAPSSQYGDPIPTIVHHMRVAGVVLWLSDPVATATVSKSGTSPGMSVSFAYGLSSGRVKKVLRIWADGRLIRDGEGRQEVPFTLRLHDGDEDQLSDPLIASILGEDHAPAFRGIAYVVFENFDLSTFGSRLPLITVEVVGTRAEVTAEQIIQDSLGLERDANEQEHELTGYALLGDDQGTAVAPLCDAFSPSFSYGGRGWSLATSSDHHVLEEALWRAEQGQEGDAEIEGSGSLPSKVSVRYFDPAIDFAAGEKSARLPGPERLLRIELPAALKGSCAKAAAFEQLAKAAAKSDQLWLTLPLSYSVINVGDKIIRKGQRARSYIVCAKILKAGKLRVKLRREATRVDALASDSGGRLTATKLGREPLTLALLETSGSMFDSEPEVAILVSGGHEPFQALPLIIKVNGSEQALKSANTQSLPGRLLKPLPASRGEVLDLHNAIELTFERDPLLTNCDQAALLQGANLICVGSEFVQFLTAEQLGDTSYRLTGLVRGRFDTEVSQAHESGTVVYPMDLASVAKIKVSRDHIGSSLNVTAHGPDDTIAEAELVIRGPAARPWAPAHINVVNAPNGIRISWIRRCKEGGPWLDGVDAPLGSTGEAYRVELTDQSGGKLELTTDRPSAEIGRALLDELGARPWHLEVRQLGDFAPSKPSIHIID